MSEDPGFNRGTPVMQYLGGLGYFVLFVLVGSYLAFRMPFL